MQQRPLLKPGLRRAALLCSLSALAAPSMAWTLQSPQYQAAIDISPDIYKPDETLSAGKPPGRELQLAPRLPDSTTVRLTHTSFQGTGTIGNASATAEHGGTVRASASTADEQIGSYAGIYYEFQIEAKPGAVLPALVPLRVQASGSTGSDGWAVATISFGFAYRQQPHGAVSNIYQYTGVQSAVNQSPVVFGGNGSIYVDEWAEIAPYTPIIVSMSARAGAGIGMLGLDHDKDEYGTGSAWVDPVFTVAPEYRNLVNIVGVPVAAVPEPATWAMSLAGLLALGALLRRQRRRR